MSAIISNKVMMKEVLKATGFDCPDGMENKTFEEAASGGGGSGGDRSPQELNVTANGTYQTPSGVYYDPINVNVPLPGVTMVDVQTDSIASAGTPVIFRYEYDAGLDANYVVWIGKEQINTRDLVAGQSYQYTTISGSLMIDIHLSKLVIDGNKYRVNAVYKAKSAVSTAPRCFLVVGTFN